MRKIKLIILLFLSLTGIRSEATQRFEFPACSITLSRPVQPWNHLTVVGRKSFFAGKETGTVEAWVLPFKIFHDFHFSVKMSDTDYSLDLASLARYIWVRPEATTIRFAHSAFTIDATYFAPLEKPGLIILLDINSSEDLQLTAHFHSDLQPMWPGGLGGQFSYWDAGEKAFVISESRRKYAALVGSPFADRGSSTPAHAQPNAPIQFTIPLTADSVMGQFIPIVIAGSTESLEQAKAEYHDLLRNLKSLYLDNVAHYRRLQENFLRVVVPDDSLSLALEWAKVALDRGLMENPRLGRGLVAGIGPSGKSARPGFAWFFGGDAAINSWAINSYGDFATVRESLAFFLRYQRKDGKIAHEISQSAALIPWFEEYPYTYYHAETTPLFLITVSDYLNYSGDRRFIRQNWTSLRKAYDYCLSADANGDGLMDNLRAGLGAVELGKLRKAETEVDIYLATTWLRALAGIPRLARIAGDEKTARQAETLFNKAKSTFQQRFWRPQKEQFSFAALTDGTTLDDITTWQALPLCFDLATPEQAAATVNRLSQTDMITGWGVHFLAKSSPKYEFNGYNTGAVWPFTTMFVIWGAYRHHYSDFAYLLWQNLAALTFTQQLGAISELFSGDRFHPIEAAVPHQLFSTTPVVVGFVRGLLGYLPDLPANQITFSPHWPRHWQKGTVHNLPFGSQKLTMAVNLAATSVRFTLSGLNPDGNQVNFRLPLVPGENCSSLKQNGRSMAFERQTEDGTTIVVTQFEADSTVTLEFSGQFRIDNKRQTLKKRIGSQ